MKTTILASELRAAETCKSKDWSRAVLCGVLVRAEEGVTSIVATDSYHMVAMETRAEQSFGFEPGKCIIDTSGIKIPSKKNEVCIIEYSEGEKQVKLDFYYSNKRYTVDAIEGNYPNYRQLIPSEDAKAAEVTSASFNPKFMGNIGKAAQIWSGNSNYATTIEFQGANKPYVMFAEDGKRSFFGLVMPVRNDDKHLEQPSKGKAGAKSDEWKAKAEKFEKALIKAEKENAELRKNPGKKAADARADYAKEIERLEKELAKMTQLRDHWYEESDKLSDLACKEHSENKLLIAEVERLKSEVRMRQTEESKPDELQAKVDALVSEHSKITVLGETSCAIYLGGIKKGTPEHEAVKAAGARFGNHKKHGKCWYIPR